MVRPVKYIIMRKDENIPKSELPKLPLDSLRGITEYDIPKFKALGIDSIPKLAESEFSKIDKGAPLTEYRINKGISYALDVMEHAEEPDIDDEIMPIDEMLDRNFEKTSPTQYGNLDVITIQGIAKRNAKRLKEAGVATTIQELADAKLKDIESAGLYEWEAKKYSQYAQWIMSYAKTLKKKASSENIDIKIDNTNKLILKIDVTKEFGNSKSGKTIIVANTHGNRRIPDTNIFIGLFAYKYPSVKDVKKKKKVVEMQNVVVKTEGDIKILIIDLNNNFGLSASGKSIIIASSRGNKKFEDTDVFFGLNVYELKKKKPTKKKN